MQFFPALSHTIAFLPFSHSILLLSFHSSFHLTCQFSIFGFTLTPFPPLHLPAFLPARNIFVSKHNVSIYLSLSHFLIFFLFLSVPLLFRVPLLSSTVVSNFLHFDFLFASPLECVFRFALHNPFQWHLHLVFLLLFPPLQLSNYNFPLGEGGGASKSFRRYNLCFIFRTTSIPFFCPFDGFDPYRFHSDILSSYHYFHG